MRFRPKNLIERHMQWNPKQIPDEFRSHIQFDLLHDHVRKGAEISEAIKDSKTTERTALLLCAFLAHWGMFRGSSKLKDTNLYFFQRLCRDLLDQHCGVLTPIAKVGFEDLYQIEADDLKSIITGVENAFKAGGVKPTATLVSKTMLGLLGNVPAYDRIFVAGLTMLRDEGRYSGVVSFGPAGLRDLSKWCNRYSWPSIRSTVGKRRKLPRGRLVDMAIFQCGRSATG